HGYRAAVDAQCSQDQSLLSAMMSDSPIVRADSEAGFTLMEALVSTTLLLVVCATVMKGVIGIVDTNRVVTNRVDMHNGVRHATELLTQEVGQAGRITLPGTVTLSAGAALFDTTLSLSSTGAGKA